MLRGSRPSFKSAIYHVYVSDANSHPTITSCFGKHVRDKDEAGSGRSRLFIQGGGYPKTLPTHLGPAPLGKVFACVELVLSSVGERLYVCTPK